MDDLKSMEMIREHPCMYDDFQNYKYSYTRHNVRLELAEILNN